MSSPVNHDSFTIERTLKASRKRAYEVWSNYDLKAKWFVGPAGRWTQVKREQDFVVGGKEVLIGAFTQGGSSHFDAVYMDIVDQERIVYAYRMFVDDELLSVSLATVLFEDAGEGTRMTFTEQGVFYTSDRAAAESRKVGSEMLVDNMTKFAEQNP